MTDETTTQPLLKSMLEEMRGGFATLREEMRAGFAAIDERLTRVEARLDRIETRLVGVEKQVEIINRRLAKFADEISSLTGRVDLLEESNETKH